MKRRDFIQLSAVSLTASLITPAITQAETQPTPANTADIYYTKDSAGRWSSKVATHLPTIEITKADSKVTVSVVTAHEMKGYEHYIVKHVLLDNNHKFIAEHLFNPSEDKLAQSTFTLENYSGGTVYALSLCNKHDLWLNSAAV